MPELTVDNSGEKCEDCGCIITDLTEPDPIDIDMVDKYGCRSCKITMTKILNKLDDRRDKEKK